MDDAIFLSRSSVTIRMGATECELAPCGNGADVPHPSRRHAIDTVSLLRTVSIFSHLTTAQLTLLAASLGTQCFAREQTIFHQGDCGDTLYLIACGQVRIYCPSTAGRELALAIYRSGDFFGELALLDGKPRSASAEAMLPTLVLTLGRAAFMQTIRTCPSIVEPIMTALAARLRATSAYAEHLANPSAHQRVGGLLLDLARRYGVAEADGMRIDLHLTQDDLASFLGLTRETVNRVLGYLRDQGLIAFEDGQLVVRDCVRLERGLVAAGGCAGKGAG